MGMLDLLTIRDTLDKMGKLSMWDMIDMWYDGYVG